MSVRTDITPKAIALAAEQQRTEAHLAGVKVQDLTASRDLIGRDIEEVTRQLTWWDARMPHSDVTNALNATLENMGRRYDQVRSEIEAVGRAQQDHERAAAELDALALAAQAEWEQRQARPAEVTRSDLTADDPPPVGGLSLAELRSLINVKVRIRWHHGGDIVGVLDRVLRNEHGGEVVALGLNQDGTLLHIDPEDVAAIVPDDHPDEPGPARTGQDDTGPDRAEAGRMVADTGYPTAPANGPEAAQ